MHTAGRTYPQVFPVLGALPTVCQSHLLTATPTSLSAPPPFSFCFWGILRETLDIMSSYLKFFNFS